MGGGKRPGGPKARMKADAPFNRKIVACEGCGKDEGHVDMCQIRKLNFQVFGQKCPREKQLKEARKKVQKKVKKKRKRSRKK